MSEKNRQMRPDETVSSGQSQTPLYRAALEGIEKIKLQLKADSLEGKRAAILDAPKYGEEGIAVLFEVLDKENNTNVYWLAYQVLQTQNDTEIQAKLRNYFPCYKFESLTVNSHGDIVKKALKRAKYYREELGNGIYLDMVYITGGKFIMGSPASEKKSHWSRGQDEPQHEVTVQSYWMGKYAVTQEQYQTVIGKNPSKFQDNSKNPVENVSWYDAKAFCQKLKELTGKDFRLPTEAEWEYACRAGTTTPFYCGESISTELANYNGDSRYGQGKRGINRRETTPVGSFAANPWGLYDMHGNVDEWCEDGWHDNYYGAPLDGRAWTGNFSQPNARVLRGGSWYDDADCCRSADRNVYGRDAKFYYYGFRVACSVWKT